MGSDKRIMPIKTILAHMANDNRHTARLTVAAAMARRFEAFVEALYIATPVSMPAAVTGRAASYGYIAEATAVAREQAAVIEQEARQALKDLSFSWTVAEGDHVDLLAARATYADLAVVTQSHPAHLEDRLPLHLPDRLPLYTPCPTLVLPYDHPADQAVAGRHILLAWRNSRESGIAVRNARHFLAEAEKVTVLTVDAAESRDDSGHDLIVFLERHGVRASHRAEADRGDVGQIILDTAEELGCDMVVMGAYGHSRLRELVFGGATRTVMRNMRTPVLMSH